MVFWPKQDKCENSREVSLRYYIERKEYVSLTNIFSRSKLKHWHLKRQENGKWIKRFSVHSKMCKLSLLGKRKMTTAVNMNEEGQAWQFCCARGSGGSVQTPAQED